MGDWRLARVKPGQMLLAAPPLHLIGCWGLPGSHEAEAAAHVFLSWRPPVQPDLTLTPGFTSVAAAAAVISLTVACKNYARLEGDHIFWILLVYANRKEIRNFKS